MLYSLVTIRPNVFKKKWDVTFSDDPEDRHPYTVKQPMAAQGFFYYETGSLTREEAFETLRDAIVKEYQTLMQSTQKTIDILNNTKVPRVQKTNRRRTSKRH